MSTVQVNCRGMWKDLAKLRVRLDKERAPQGNLVKMWVAVNYDVPSAEVVPTASSIKIFEARANELPASTTIYDSDTESDIASQSIGRGATILVHSSGMGRYRGKAALILEFKGDPTEYLLGDQETLQGVLVNPFGSVVSVKWWLQTQVVVSPREPVIA
jgi:hypothetical protein